MRYQNFKKIIDSNLVFGTVVAIFIVSLAFITCTRGGKDLKVDLFGVEQTLQKKSPYENPTDPKRPIYRYAPGFAILQYPFLLKSKMIAPFKFKDITLSIFAWYLVEILSLLFCAMILLRLIPSPEKEISIRNLKISFLMAMPLIGYELTNGQNKLIALFFMLLAIFLFEKNKLFLSAISFSFALTIYVALLPFLIYFILREKRFVFSFIMGAIIVFFIFPSLVYGFGFNNFLLKDWFIRTLKPFFLAKSYANYIDLRVSNQALPGAIGRIFVSGKTGNFRYLISPLTIHIIIRVFSAVIVLLSCIAVWKHSKARCRGLGYAIFLVLALILPQYCIFYTWAWIFVLYFAVFNFISYPQVPTEQRRPLLILVFASYFSICLIGIHTLNYFSFIFWTTTFLWLGMVFTLFESNN